MNSKNYVLTICLVLLSGICTYAQWTSTPSPFVFYRYDDVYFINPTMGWAINFANGPTDGMVIKTVDGGQSWQTVFDSSGARFRDVGFADSLHGWIGTLSTGVNPQDTTIMYQTTDGGFTWIPVPNFPGPSLAGICGMCVINDSTIYACGRYPGPAGFYKTTNKGQSWSYTDMSAFAGGLVDIHFFSADSGFVVGTSGTWNLNNGRILFTSDGGNTWQIKHTSAHTKEICWKISFPSDSVGYVSLESFRGTGPQFFLKTTDRGMTWQDMLFTNSGTYDSEGIGFINDNTGWIGGGTFNYKTTDGGLSWTMDSWGTKVNRFRFFADSVGYAAGSAIYKFENGSSSVQENSTLEIVRVFPTPFSTDISVIIKTQTLKQARISIRNILGQTVVSLKENNLHGSFSKTFDLSFLSKGIYVLDILLDGSRTVKKIVKE